MLKVLVNCVKSVGEKSMISDNIWEMEKRIDEYFENVTDDQLQKDLNDKAGYEWYKQIDERIFSE